MKLRSSGLLIGQLVLGPLSDQRGRRKLLLGSTLVCAVASLLCALAPSIGWLVAWRFLQGMAGAGGVVLARAIAARPAVLPVHDGVRGGADSRPGDRR